MFALGVVCPGGYLLPGVSALWGITACTEADPPVKKQMPVKILPCSNFFAGGTNHKVHLFGVNLWSKHLTNKILNVCYSIPEYHDFVQWKSHLNLD